MSGRSKWYRRWRPRSLQARQLLAASLSLVAFLALAGYALDVAFADTAEKNLRERLKNYANAYTYNIDFVRDGSLYLGGQPPDPRFDVPGGGCMWKWCDLTKAIRPYRPKGRAFRMGACWSRGRKNSSARWK